MGLQKELSNLPKVIWDPKVHAHDSASGKFNDDREGSLWANVPRKGPHLFSQQLGEFSVCERGPQPAAATHGLQK
jgi:hypothetical protein